MEEEYYLDEKIDDFGPKGKYVPVSGKLHKRGEMGFVENSFPWQRVFVDRFIRKGTPVFVVSYIHHSSKDDAARAFLKESDARKYITALGKAIVQKYGVQEADVHYGQGSVKILDLLLDMPLNTFTNFRTLQDEFSVTFIKTNY